MQDKWTVRPWDVRQPASKRYRLFRGDEQMAIITADDGLICRHIAAAMNLTTSVQRREGGAAHLAYRGRRENKISRLPARPSTET